MQSLLVLGGVPLCNRLVVLGAGCMASVPAYFGAWSCLRDTAYLLQRPPRGPVGCGCSWLPWCSEDVRSGLVVASKQQPGGKLMQPDG